MDKNRTYHQQLKSALTKVISPTKAQAAQRFFPGQINCIGAAAPDIKNVIRQFQLKHNHLNAEEFLSLTEYLLENAEYHEDVLLAFGLINRFVKHNYDENLLSRFEYWLENYASNWAHVDDLCIKTIYQYFLSRPHLIHNTQSWAYSKVPWCRRASNVVWVKFVKRKIGKSVYHLDKQLIFRNCDILLNDEDDYVQKSVGWLLKATSQYHEPDVINYLERHHERITRHTLRYAIEKMDSETRKRILSFKI